MPGMPPRPILQHGHGPHHSHNQVLYPNNQAQKKESDWIAHTKTDGKVYYFNKVTQQSTWEKPDELKTPVERALSACPWKEYKTEDGRKYYSNSVTKETVWKVPAEYQAIIDTFDIPLAPSATPTDSTITIIPAVPVVANISHPQAAVVSMNFETKEEAEAAFKEMLEQAEIGLDWTWEQTMRQVINKPMYRSLKTLAERKQAFQEFVVEKKKKIKEAQEEKLNYERDTFIGLLGSLGPDLNVMLKYKKMCEIFAEDPGFQSIEDERRVALFDEFMTEFRRKDAEEKRTLRKENVERFKHILKTTPTITALTTWNEAQNLWATHPDFLPPSPNSINPLHSMEPIDILVAFEDHMKQLEAVLFEEIDVMRNHERRVERQNRDEFKALLDKLVKQGVIHIQSKWKEVYPYLANELAFDKILGQPGSTPIELFWDVLVGLEDLYLAVRKEALDAVRNAGIVIEVHTPYSEFEREFIDKSRSNTKFDKNTLKQIYQELISKAAARSKEDERRKERKTKKRMDSFKYLLRHLSPRLTSNATWETTVPLVKGTDEYLDLDEEQRIFVFEKVLKRLKEKELEVYSDSSDDDDEDKSLSRKRKISATSGRDKERERDRDRIERDREREVRNRDEPDKRKKRRPEDGRDRDDKREESNGGIRRSSVVSEREEGEL